MRGSSFFFFFLLGALLFTREGVGIAVIILLAKRGGRKSYSFGLEDIFFTPLELCICHFL